MWNSISVKISVKQQQFGYFTESIWLKWRVCTQIQPEREHYEQDQVRQSSCFGSFSRRLTALNIRRPKREKWKKTESDRTKSSSDPRAAKWGTNHTDKSGVAALRQAKKGQNMFLKKPKKKLHPVRTESERATARTGIRPRGHQAAAASGRFMKKNGMWYHCWLLRQVSEEGPCTDQKVMWGRPEAPSCSTHLSVLTGCQGAGAAQRERNWKKDFIGEKKNSTSSAPVSDAFHCSRHPLVRDWVKERPK